jgi:hypothetical protein
MVILTSNMRDVSKKNSRQIQAGSVFGRNESRRARNRARRTFEDSHARAALALSGMTVVATGLVPHII